MAVAEAGPNFGTGSNVDVGGIGNWANPTNVGADDGAVASAALTGTSVSNRLLVDSFGFNIPEKATIRGIEIEIERAGSGPASTESILDQELRLTKTGAVIGMDKSSGSYWPTSLGTPVTYGGPTDLWGATWTATEVNDDLGFALRVNSDLGAPANAEVDYVTVTVYHVFAELWIKHNGVWKKPTNFYGKQNDIWKDVS